MMKYWFFLFFVPTLAFAQTHVLPPDEADGIPAIGEQAFLITWEADVRARVYEYVLTDNPLCFAGCAGDTRQAETLDTFAIEANLQPNTWYYWTTRILYTDGTASPWSAPSRFFARQTEAEQLARIFPNPSTGQELWAEIDWGWNENVRTVRVDILDVRGRLIRSGLEARRLGTRERFSRAMWSVGDLPTALYWVRFQAVEDESVSYVAKWLVVSL